MQMIKQFLSGKLALWKSFLIFGILGKFTLFFLTSLALHALAGQAIPALAVAVLALAAGALIWICEWRCAFNTRYRILGFLLRIWLILSVVGVTLNALPHMPPAIAMLSLIALTLGIFCIIAYYGFIAIRDFIRNRRQITA